MTLQGDPADCASVMHATLVYYTSLEFQFEIWTSETLKDCSLERLKNYFLGRFAPYLERDWLRSFTPAQSKEPRTVW